MKQLFLYAAFLLMVTGNELSLHKMNDDSPSIVYQVSTRKSFCFPTNETMKVFDDEVNNHDWGYTMDLFNYSSAIRRVGQVLCQQLGFSILESISPVPNHSSYSQPILWVASCLGYEPMLSHCFYQKIEDPSLECQSLVGLKCVNCHKKLVLKLDEPQEIFSPGFPVSYPDSTICEWQLSTDDGFETFGFTVKLEHLSMPRKNHEGNCAFGYLSISGNSKNNQFCLKEKIICGFTSFKEFTWNCSVLVIRWNSGIFHPRPHHGTPWGFRLKVEAISNEKKSLSIESNLHSGSISFGNLIGIVIGALSIIIIFVSGYFGCRFMLRKRAETLSRLSMAERIDSRRNNLSGGRMTIHPHPKLQLTNNKTDFNNVLTNDGNVPRDSISSGIYEEWNEKFTLNRNCDKEAYLMLEEALRRSTLSPKYFGSDIPKGNLELKFQYPIPVVKITAATEHQNFFKETNSSTSDISSFTGSVGSNNVFCEDAISQQDHLYTNEDAHRKSTYTVIKNISETISENIDKQNFESSLHQLKVDSDRKSLAIEELNVTGQNFHKTLSQRFSIGHILDQFNVPSSPRSNFA